jgi:hypothetical protein
METNEDIRKIYEEIKQIRGHKILEVFFIEWFWEILSFIEHSVSINIFRTLIDIYDIGPDALFYLREIERIPVSTSRQDEV